MKLQAVDFDAYREQFDAQYQAPAWHSGLPATQVSLEIRRIYCDGELRQEPFILTKSRMLAFALRHVRVAVYGYDSFASVCEATQELVAISWQRAGILSEQALGAEAWSRLMADNEAGFFDSKVDLSHTAPDWDAVLALGVPGLLARAQARNSLAPSPFLQAVVIVYEALADFLQRFAEAARAVGRLDLAEMLEFLVDHAPVTLQQALELGLVFREMQEMEGELVRSMGLFDRQYLPFYENDLANGTLTEAEAENLLAIYFSRNHARSQGRDAGAHYCFGGLRPDGQKDGCNALTRISLRAFRRVARVDPKFSLRVNDQTPRDILKFAFECVKDGQSAILFINEEIVRKALLRNGKELHDLANFIPIGCYEPSIMGKELCCSMTGTMNLAKAVEKLMSDDFHPADFEAILERYWEIVAQALRTQMDRINALECEWSRINPAPTLSGTMLECMEQGRDATENGTKYRSSGIMCAGLGTVVDSLAAINHLVFEQKILAFPALCEILRHDWTGSEQLRLIARRQAPKWGNNDDRVDSLAVWLTQRLADLIETYPNGKGGHFQLGIWSIDWCLSYGKLTAATPDGRHAGETLSKNTGSTIGCDTNGVAGLVESVTKLDYSRFANGSVLDVMLAQASIQKEVGTAYLETLFQTFRARGGAFMHFNVLSAEELKAAQKEPEKYRNLQIRLCGWNVRFIDLAQEMQDCLIREAEGKSLV